MKGILGKGGMIEGPGLDDGGSMQGSGRGIESQSSAIEGLRFVPQNVVGIGIVLESPGEGGEDARDEDEVDGEESVRAELDVEGSSIGDPANILTRRPSCPVVRIGVRASLSSTLSACRGNTFLWTCDPSISTTAQCKIQNTK